MVSRTKRGLLCIASYPGTVLVLVGSWPCSLFPGILAVPFLFWWPAPFWSLEVQSVGNEKGFESAFPVEMYSLVGWVTVLVVMAIFSQYRVKANKSKHAEL